MKLLAETRTDGVSELLFRHETGGADVPGVLWTPADADADGARPLLLLGHGGGQHKLAPTTAALARRAVTGFGFAVASVDAPGHGERPRSEEERRQADELLARIAAGDSVAPQVARIGAMLAEQAVPEWRSVLGVLRERLGVRGPVGYWGLSLGSHIGLRLAAAETGVGAAVLGLVGDPGLCEPAARIKAPVRFLLQWDDELVDREGSLALFDALGSSGKSLHTNPGRHGDLPEAELDDGLRFLLRALGRSPDHRPP